MQEQIESWVGAVRPWVEQEYGPLSDFICMQYGPIRFGGPYATDVDLKNGTGSFLYDPKWFERRQFLNQQIKNYDSQTIGLAACGITHELIHLYQAKPLSERLKNLKPLPSKIIDLWVEYRYNEWVEGLAELASLKINLSRIDSELPPILPAESFLEMLQGNQYQHAFLFFHKQRLTWMINGLAIAGLIKHLNLDSLELPFNIVASTKSRIKPEGFLPVKQPNHYQKGFLRCARVVSRTGISINELLRTPLTNKELKEQAGI